MKTTQASTFALTLAASLFLEPAVADMSSATIEPIPDEIWRTMQGRSWHASFDDAKCKTAKACTCPPRDSLVMVSIPYRDFDNETRVGRMVVARDVASEVVDIFVEIFESRTFRIQTMEMVDHFGGDDDSSMAANNTSAFNCRLTTGGSRLSSHALGTAIDINPVQNPYVRGDTTLPPAGDAFDEASERTEPVPGLVVRGDVVTTAFAKRGWTWGGDWSSLKDYQHFSKDGR